MSFCCFCISDEPIEHGRIKTRIGEEKFQTDMMNAPFIDCPTSCCWCCGQFIPFTCGCTQYFLRRKVLEGDMSKYSCCQGYMNCCGIGAGSFSENNCPDFCACLEGCICNGFAVSASRLSVMDRYNLNSDPCDYRLIRINNCLQMLACICDILALFDRNLQGLANIIDFIADLFYHTITGCMTAQVAYEMDYQIKKREEGPAIPYYEPELSPMAYPEVTAQPVYKTY